MQFASIWQVSISASHSCTSVEENNRNYYSLNSPFILLCAESVQWILEISAVTSSSWRLYNNHVKDTQGHGNHVMYDRGAWFLRVITSSSRALCCLPSVKKKKHDCHFNFRSMYYKIIIRFGFCDIHNNQGLGKGYQPQPLASVDNPYLDFDYSGYHKNLIQELIIVTWM